MNEREYQKYLKGSHWRKIRGKKLETAGQTCEECGANSFDVILDIHHLTYERIGRERLSDLKVLCRDCHEKAHGIRPTSAPADPGFVYGWDTVAMHKDILEKRRDIQR